MKSEQSHGSMSERKRMILKAIIDVHIRLGEPVGSKYLAQSQQFTLSGATIRNEMAELEEMGYLEQPHTSAGRIPSHAGYRLYVDSLMQTTPLSDTSQVVFLNGKNRKTSSDEIMLRVGKMLSELTGYTSVVMKAGGCSASVRRFDVIALDSTHIILVAMLDADNVKSATVTLQNPVSQSTLELLTSVLNRNLSGKTMEEINLSVMVSMETEMEGDSWILSPVMKCIYSIIGDREPAELHFEGISKLLHYPEFSDMERVREMMELFEKKDELSALIASGVPGRVNVIIGGETSLRSLSDVTIIYRTVCENGAVVAAAGVIGPCRMDYSRIVSIVDTVVRRAAETLGYDSPNALPSARP